MSNTYEKDSKTANFDRELDEILMGNDYERPKMDKGNNKFTNVPKTKIIRKVFEKNAEQVAMRTYFDELIKRKNREIEERRQDRVNRDETAQD